MGLGLSPGCDCCTESCAEWTREWCGVDTSPSGVTESSGEYTINDPITEFGWGATITFPALKQSASGVCGAGSTWTTGTFQHDISIVRQSDSEVLLKIRLTIYHNVTGDDYLKVETLDTTAANFTSHLLQDYATNSYSERYVPTMTITRREEVTAIQFGSQVAYVSPFADGDSWDSLTKSKAIYVDSDGTAADVVKLVFVSTSLTGNTAEPTGDWSVYWYELSADDGVDMCPNPKICDENEPSYSSPQWVISAVSIDSGTAPIQSASWQALWESCVGELTQNNPEPLQSQSDSNGGYFYIGFSNAEPDDLATFDGSALSSVTEADIGPALVKEDPTGGVAYSPQFTTTVLPSATPGKRKVRLEMTLTALEYNIFSAQTMVAFILGVNTTATYTGSMIGNQGWDPGLTTQVPSYFFLFNSNFNDYLYCESDGSGGKQLTSVTTNNSIPCPDDLTISTYVTDHWEPMYFTWSVDIATELVKSATWEKEVDEWDGDPPTITFTSSDLTFFPGSSSVVVTEGRWEFTATQSLTFKTLLDSGVVEATIPCYKCDNDYGIDTVNFNNTSVTIVAASGPMSQPS